MLKQSGGLTGLQTSKTQTRLGICLPCWTPEAIVSIHGLKELSRHYKDGLMSFSGLRKKP